MCYTAAALWPVGFGQCNWSQVAVLPISLELILVLQEDWVESDDGRLVPFIEQRELCFMRYTGVAHYTYSTYSPCDVCKQ